MCTINLYYKLQTFTKLSTNKDKHCEVWKYHLAFDRGPSQITSNRYIFITNKWSCQTEFTLHKFVVLPMICVIAPAGRNFWFYKDLKAKLLFESNAFIWKLKTQEGEGKNSPSPPLFLTLSVGQRDNSFKFRPFRLFQAKDISFFSKSYLKTLKNLVIRTL